MLESERALHHVEKFGAGMLVRLQFLLGDGLELSQIGIGATLVAFEVEALEVVGNLFGAGTIWQV